jgi:DNA-directed RNA polymerase specialized sigma subunit
MTVKEYLGQAYLLDNRINSDTKELEELRLMSQTISSPGFEEHYNASRNTDAPYIHTLEKIFDMESKILEEVDLLMALKQQIRDVISKVEKPEHQMIMRYRYIHNYSWSKISNKLSADITTVQRWHNKAIAKIKLPENAIDLKVAIVCHKMP